MSQNILVLIRNEVAAVSEKLDNLASNLPNVDEINQKLDAQSASLQTLTTDVTTANSKLDAITAILNPTVPPTK
ncbi:p10 [Spodoptera frugiperda granulovirus]|uniref:p10 n=1 Tax=Spodoptera frugiperda granulovirus TaxID=307454 RepID=A0A068FN21_9BBAC|nr:p10 [Spodoptera frugiperda granulovirus]AID68441.1 p10 [Spodoptera frugiperda granulovirus]AJK91666.1 p10 [Spodoptera frugiperda granulovirus]AXS01024.1 p10 [Spodoptera frugiperda granulovirus]